MKKIFNQTFTIEQLADFLRTTTEDVVSIRSSRIKAGWHDVEFVARRCGFIVYIYNDEELIDKHEFSECYKFFRK